MCATISAEKIDTTSISIEERSTMKTVIALVGAIAMMMFSATTSSAATLTAGTYQAKFFGGCGVLTVKSGGQKVSYKFFRGCGDSATFSSNGSFDGSVIKIQAARMKVSSASKTEISGTWTLRGESASPTFLKIN